MTQAQHETPMSPFGQMLFDCFAPVTPYQLFEQKWEEWNAERTKAFPNYAQLCPGYDADYPRLKAWEKENPAPRAPYCKACGQEYHANESRWCCNPFCKYYLI